MGKTKVAILGGGVGGITTAYALTSTPELRHRFEVTVYTRGWRIGGKGASGRNAAQGQRIEEHGLHVWFGFYDNAFRLMRECYEELGRAPEDPLHDLNAAFTPCDTTVLWDHSSGTWYPWLSVSPRNPIPPGTDEGLPVVWDLFGAALNWANDQWRELLGRHKLLERSPFPGWVTDLLPAANFVGRTVAHLFEILGDIARALLGRDPSDDHDVLCRVVAFVRKWLWEHFAESRIDDDQVRLFFTGFDTIATAMIGILQDRVLEQGFRSIDHLELTDWLRGHGLHDVTAGATFLDRAPSLRAIYDMAFCFLDGDVQQPSIAAGAAVRNMLLLGTTKNTALYFKMNAGMGDAIFTPYYEVLRRRGVRFEFFQWVDAVHVDALTRTVTSVDVIPQVTLQRDAYDPLVTVRGLESWPNEPRWEQIAEREELQKRGVNLEFESNPLGHNPKTLQRGVDFDTVVLAIPAGALGPITKELAAVDARFASMLANVHTVATQAFQLWMRPTVDELGWPGGSLSLSGCYVEPLDTYADMSHVLDREDWPGEAPGSVGYFCGVIDDVPGESLAAATSRAKAAALEFIDRDLRALWPNAFDATGFRWDLLFDQHGGVGPQRFASQYWRANADPSERYVLSPPGAALHRLAADESGFANLYLAGDWTRNGLDAGCVEAATISGLQAARAISGHAFTIVAEDDRWLTNRRTR